MSPELVELSRQVANLIRLGTIAEVDHSAARCRVRSGGLLTGWLPWVSPRVGTTRDWDPPTLSEQVLLFAPSGEVAAAVVLTGIYSDANAAPSNAPTLHRRVYPDGAVIEYDHASHHMDMTSVATLSISATGGITVHGNITVVGDVVADGISLKNHVHGGVVPGGGTTGAPQ